LPLSSSFHTFKKEQTVVKEIAPENFLGRYLTNKNLSNVEIYYKTGIPATDLSRMRNGEISAVPAHRLYLISLVTGDTMEVVLKEVFPNLTLIHTNNPLSSKIKETTTPIGRTLFSLEEYTFEAISYKTGITISRLRNLATKETSIVLSHQLYLIELAANRKPGLLFNKLFENVKLNTETEQKRLQNEDSNDL